MGDSLALVAVHEAAHCWAALTTPTVTFRSSLIWPSDGGGFVGQTRYTVRGTLSLRDDLRLSLSGICAETLVLPRASRSIDGYPPRREDRLSVYDDFVRHGQRPPDRLSNHALICDVLVGLRARLSDDFTFLAAIADVLERRKYVDQRTARELLRNMSGGRAMRRPHMPYHDYECRAGSPKYPEFWENAQQILERQVEDCGRRMHLAMQNNDRNAMEACKRDADRHRRSYRVVNRWIQRLRGRGEHIEDRCAQYFPDESHAAARHTTQHRDAGGSPVTRASLLAQGLTRADVLFSGMYSHLA